MEWLNQNAGAVQAIMAVIIGFLTVALIVVTCWYAALTRRMALTMERQLAASFQPDIDLQLQNLYHGSAVNHGVRSENISVTLVVTNKGDVPVKIAAVAMKVVFDNTAFPSRTITCDAGQRVLAPGKMTQFLHLTVDVPLGSTDKDYERFVQIHCSDLAGVSPHTFSLSDRDENIVNQSLGFQPI